MGGVGAQDQKAGGALEEAAAASSAPRARHGRSSRLAAKMAAHRIVTRLQFMKLRLRAMFAVQLKTDFAAVRNPVDWRSNVRML
jgi:hypothetical protein